MWGSPTTAGYPISGTAKNLQIVNSDLVNTATVLMAALGQDFDSKVGGEALFCVKFEQVFARHDALFIRNQLIQTFKTDGQHVRELCFLVREHFYQDGQALLFLFREQGRVSLSEGHDKLAQEWAVDAEDAPRPAVCPVHLRDR